MVRNIRVGVINITGIKGSSASVDEVAHALSGLVVNATVSVRHQEDRECSDGHQLVD